MVEAGGLIVDGIFEMPKKVHHKYVTEEAKFGLRWPNVESTCEATFKTLIQR